MVGIGDLLGDAAAERLGHRLDHHREGAGLGHRLGVGLDRRPVVLVAALRAERADGVDRLRRQADMAHHRHAALDQEGDGLRHARGRLRA